MWRAVILAWKHFVQAGTKAYFSSECSIFIMLTLAYDICTPSLEPQKVAARDTPGVSGAGGMSESTAAMPPSFSFPSCSGVCCSRNAMSMDSCRFTLSSAALVVILLFGSCCCQFLLSCFFRYCAPPSHNPWACCGVWRTQMGNRWGISPSRG